MRCPECAKQRTRVVRPRAMANATPVATQAIIAINVLVYLAELVDRQRLRQRQRRDRSIEKGALCGPADPVSGRVLAARHDRLPARGFFHVAFNMVLIWFIGRSLEPAIGTARFVVAYGASLLCGSLGVMLLELDAVAVGASGAAFGLLGALSSRRARAGSTCGRPGCCSSRCSTSPSRSSSRGSRSARTSAASSAASSSASIYDQCDRRRLPRRSRLRRAPRWASSRSSPRSPSRGHA